MHPDGAEGALDIRLTLGGWGHIVSAHWSEPRARTAFLWLPTEGQKPNPRTLREVCELSEEKQPSSGSRRTASQRVQED